MNMTRKINDESIENILLYSRWNDNFVLLLIVQWLGCGGTPQYLNRLLANRAGELRRVEVISVNPLDDTFTNPELKDSFFVNSLFASAYVRPLISNGTASYIPTFLHEMPLLFDNKILPLDAAFIQVSPPDKHGYCSLGISVEVTRAAIRNAKYIFAQINRSMPRVHGDTFVHINQIDSFVEYDEPLIELSYNKEINKAQKKIGKLVAELIDDRSTSTIVSFFSNSLISNSNFLFLQFKSELAQYLIRSFLIFNITKIWVLLRNYFRIVSFDYLKQVSLPIATRNFIQEKRRALSFWERKNSMILLMIIPVF